MTTANIVPPDALLQISILLEVADTLTLTLLKVELVPFGTVVILPEYVGVISCITAGVALITGSKDLLSPPHWLFEAAQGKHPIFISIWR